MQRTPALLLAALAACASEMQRFDPRDAEAMLATDTLAALRAIDRVAASDDPAAAPHLLALQRDAERPLEVRARAAAALVQLGFRSGEEFCLGVLGAMLEPFAERTARLELPESDRLAFPRELAVAALRARLHDAGSTPPPFDVNYGAPDLLAATHAYERALGALPAPHPRASQAALAARIPPGPPPGWAFADWQDARRAVLEEAAR